MKDRLDEIVKRQRRQLRVLGIAGILAGLVAVGIGIATAAPETAKATGTFFLCGIALTSGGVAGIWRSFKK